MDIIESGGLFCDGLRSSNDGRSSCSIAKLLVFGAYDQTKDRMRIIADNSLESLGGLSTHFVEDSLITGDRWMHCYASRDTVHEKKLGRDRFNRPSYLINPYFAVIAGARIADGPRSIFDLPAFPFNPNKDLAGKLANSSYSGEWVRESEKRSNCYAFEFDLAKSGNINRSVFRGVFKGYPIKDLHMLESKVSWMKVEEIELPEEIVTREYSGNNKKNNGATELQYRVKWKLNASVDSRLFDESHIGKETFESIATLFDEPQ
jgi:hypothetical protein